MAHKAFKSVSFLIFLSLLVSAAHAAFTISGTVTYKGAGLAGVVMSGLPDNPVTDASGHYSVTIYFPTWTDRVIPTLAGYAFTPPYTEYVEVSADIITDYEAFDAGFRLDTYQIPSELEQGGWLINVIPIDFNHDGFMDIVAVQYRPYSENHDPVPTLAYANDGTGHFAEVSSQVLGGLYTYGGCMWSVADFNGDGYDDLFLADGGLDWPPLTSSGHNLLMGRADGTLVNEGADRVPGPREVPSWGDSGDVDNDGDIDILTTGTGGWYNLLINDGTGHFNYDDFCMPPSSLDPATGFRSANGQLLDIDRDGDLDMFFGTGESWGPEDILLINDGTGHFERAPAGVLAPRCGAGQGFEVRLSISGDVNGDGWSDILVHMGNASQGQVQLQLNRGDGTFEDATSRLWNSGVFGIGCNRLGRADFNSDGWLDLLTYNGQSRLQMNHGGLSFEDVTVGFFPGRPVSDESYPVAVDVDNDGDADIVSCFPYLHQIIVYVNERGYSIPEAPLPYPEAPYLLSPANGTALSTIEAPLSWTSVTGAVAFRLQVALDPAFSQIVCERRDLTTNAFEFRGLTGNTTYHWRVRTINTRGESTWSPAWSFMTPTTVTVSGEVTYQGGPFEGARMMDLPGQPVTDATGHYETQVEAGWSGTARPYRANYNFVPETTSYTNVVSSQTTDYLAYIGIPQHERQALAAFYNSTGGDSWTNKTGWKEPPLEADGFAAYGSEGTWFGVTVDVMHPPQGYPVTVIGLSVSDNNLNGTLPANLGNLTNIRDFRISGAISGTLPASLASYTKLQIFVVWRTDLEGSIPAWLGNNPSLYNLHLNSNRLSGTIPPEIGNLTDLAILHLDCNAIQGPIPHEISNLAKLNDGSLAYNALFTTDSAVKAFLDAWNPSWAEGQTLAPTDVAAEAQSPSSVELTWTAPPFFSGYSIYYSTSSGGPYTFYGPAEGWETSRLVTGLNPATTYYFVLQSYSNPNWANKNTVKSANSNEASATTSALVTLAVTAPNGSESWAAGTAHPVTWTSAGLSGNITIELYKGGNFNSAIGTADVAAGTFSWNIPSGLAAGTDYKVRISQGAVEDYSDSDFTVTAGAAVWTASHRLTWTSGSSSSPKAALDASGNVHLVWYDNTPGNNEIYYKKGTGTSWATTKRLTTTSGPSQFPAIAMSSSGALHVVYWDETGGNAEVYYMKSGDGGTTWGTARRLTWTSGQSNYPSLAVDSSGAVHAVWQDNTTGNHEIYYRKSPDGGTTWAAAKRLTWTSGSSARPTVAVSSSEHIHLVWQDDTPGKAEIYYKKSTDGGANWTANKRLTWTSGHSYYPSLLVDSSGNPHVVWQDETPGNNEICYRKSPDGGGAWVASQRLSWNSGSSQEPEIAVDSSGNLQLVWTDNSPGNFEVHHRESSNGGVIWTASKNLSLTTGSSNSPTIKAGPAGSLHVFWSDGTPGNPEIYYKKRQ